jgi:hypothetical protein
MSNRFHSKNHRYAHMSYKHPAIPDAGYDPIGSEKSPFLGEFVLSGFLSAYSPNTDISVFTDNLKVDDTLYAKNVLVTDTLTAENMLVHFIDVVISETSGFAIKGEDFSQVVPTQCPINDVLLLSGVGLSGTSWASFQGDIQTSRNLVVSGVITASAIILPDGNSNGWNTSYTTVNSNSATWVSGYTSLNNLSAGWASTQSTVNANSADWSAGSDVSTLSSSWQSSYTTVNTNSALWSSYSQASISALEAALSGLQGASIGSLGTQILSATYDTWELVVLPTFVWAYATNVYTSNVNSDLKLMVADDGSGTNSILLNYGRAYTAGASEIYAFNVQGLVPPNKYWKVTANDTPSAINIFTTTLSGGGVSQLSAGYWNSAYTTVQTQSASWIGGGGSDVSLLSGNWQSTYTTVNTNSATWTAGASGNGFYPKLQLSALPLYNALYSGSITTSPSALSAIYDNNLNTDWGVLDASTQNYAYAWDLGEIYQGEIYLKFDIRRIGAQGPIVSLNDGDDIGTLIGKTSSIQTTYVEQYATSNTGFTIPRTITRPFRSRYVGFSTGANSDYQFQLKVYDISVYGSRLSEVSAGGSGGGSSNGTTNITWPLTAQGNLDMNNYSIVNIASASIGFKNGTSFGVNDVNGWNSVKTSVQANSATWGGSGTGSTYPKIQLSALPLYNAQSGSITLLPSALSAVYDNNYSTDWGKLTLGSGSLYKYIYDLGDVYEGSYHLLVDIQCDYGAQNAIISQIYGNDLGSLLTLSGTYQPPYVTDKLGNSNANTWSEPRWTDQNFRGRYIGFMCSTASVPASHFKTYEIQAYGSLLSQVSAGGSGGSSNGTPTRLTPLISASDYTLQSDSSNTWPTAVSAIFDNNPNTNWGELIVNNGGNYGCIIWDLSGNYTGKLIVKADNYQNQSGNAITLPSYSETLSGFYTTVTDNYIFTASLYNEIGGIASRKTAYNIPAKYEKDFRGRYVGLICSHNGIAGISPTSYHKVYSFEVIGVSAVNEYTIV